MTLTSKLTLRWKTEHLVILSVIFVMAKILTPSKIREDAYGKKLESAML